MADVHTEKEEWEYPTKTSISRKRRKRGISKAKRVLVKEFLRKIISE